MARRARQVGDEIDHADGAGIGEDGTRPELARASRQAAVAAGAVEASGYRDHGRDMRQRSGQHRVGVRPSGIGEQDVERQHLRSAGDDRLDDLGKLPARQGIAGVAFGERLVVDRDDDDVLRPRRRAGAQQPEIEQIGLDRVERAGPARQVQGREAGGPCERQKAE